MLLLPLPTLTRDNHCEGTEGHRDGADKAGEGAIAVESPQCALLKWQLLMPRLMEGGSEMHTSKCRPTVPPPFLHPANST